MGRAAEKLLERMRATPYGWAESDFRSLYTGFGFEYEAGANHSLFIHRVRKHLRATVPRHRSLAPTYARFAVSLIDQLLEEEKADGSG